MERLLRNGTGRFAESLASQVVEGRLHAEGGDGGRLDAITVTDAAEVEVFLNSP